MIALVIFEFLFDHWLDILFTFVYIECAKCVIEDIKDICESSMSEEKKTWKIVKKVAITVGALIVYLLAREYILIGLIVIAAVAGIFGAIPNYEIHYHNDNDYFDW